MRVLFVIHFPVFGGPHNQALRLHEALQSRGWETVVLLPAEPGNAAGRLREAGLDVVTIPLHRLRAARDPRLHFGWVAGFGREVKAIRRVIRERSIDVVQIGGLVNPHAAIAARLEGVPIVWQLIDTRAPFPVAVPAMAFVRALADVVMSTGSSVALSHPGGAAIAGRTIQFFPPVDVELFRPRPEERAAVRAEWGLPDDRPVVGCVANINPQKGIVDLVAAFAQVRERIPDARLVLVGLEYATQSGYSAEVRTAIGAARLSVGQDVVFVGARADVHRQLAGMDVFAFSPEPKGEGISTVVLEAMSAGVPVVTTTVAGIPEAIGAGNSGVLVPPGDVGLFAGAVVSLLLDPSRAGRTANAARRRAVAQFGIEACANLHLEAYERAMTSRRAAVASRRVESISLEKMVVCPSCRGSLTTQRTTLRCVRCRETYSVIEGIPVLLADAASADHDELRDHRRRRGRPDIHKTTQSAHTDRAVDEEFETTRPHGLPRFYQFLLREKFRRAASPFRADLGGATALVVCGGSGMDAEFLERSGASVVSTDISLGAARRTRVRAHRYGLALMAVVADAERLPFADQAFDLVYVHDGLHHLERPEIAIREMARVADRWVSITEPTPALATAFAIRAGIALDVEEAGNRVLRLKPSHVVEILREAGFRPLAADRYAMFYRHEPGWISRALSTRGIYPLARWAWRLGNQILGKVGNKMVVAGARNPN